MFNIIMHSDLEKLSKVKLFNSNSALFDHSEIDNFLNTLKEPYASIAESGKRPVIENNTTNMNFVKILKEDKYISSFKQEKRE